MAAAATLRTLTDDQLLDELDSARKELFNLRFAFATGQLDNSAQLGAVKRDIARIHTVLREREIAAAELPAPATTTAPDAAATAPAPSAAATGPATAPGAAQDSAAPATAPPGDQP
ncbi:50S ribosomal protein L29 [Candidatus Poriferisodalis sp.]|uniref:50S ribosomal protein L29 n=1 Tax=Candidatus Poriferisodalis sp. TaxID=3101277 RepID=UPI003B02E3B3